ncbi:MAG: DUF4838 domain-containing protein, partial [Bifidobacterium sp.]|nr:DUF4838 domain-containing protein [Bifidobacterium sp.]
KENLSSLVAWKKIFEGDSFVYDYPLGRAHYGDFGYMAISDVIYRDIRSLDRLGLNGYIACQELRAGFPTNFPDYVMGRTLWNKDISYDSLVEEYFSSLYGTQWRKAVDWLRQMSRLSSCDYFNGIGDRVNPQKAQDYAAIVRLSDGALDLIRREIGATTGLVKKEWVKLSFYREYVMLISAALCAQAGGDAAEADKKWNECLDFIRRNERNIQNELDVYRVIEVAKNYAGFTLSD